MSKAITDYHGGYMGFITEFKEFAMKGNVMDLAVGIIIGGAFQKIVSSVVADVMMPILGFFIGSLDFKDMKLTLAMAQGSKPAVTLNYGMFIQNVVDFTIVAFALFLIVKALNTLRRRLDSQSQKAAAVPPPTMDQVLLTEIRDILKTAK